MKKVLAVFAISVVFLSFNSCSTTVVKTEEVNRINSVAIVGFELFRQTDGSGLGMLSDLTSSVTDKASDVNTGNEVAEKCYDVLTQKIGSGLNWQFNSLQNLRNNRKYSELYDEKGDESRRRLNVGKTYTLNGVVNPVVIRKMSLEDRRELMAALGVDAIISFEAIAYEGSSFGTGSLGYTRYRVTLENLEIYNRISNDPIVKLKNIVGKTSDDGQLKADFKGVKLTTGQEKGLIGAVVEISHKIVSAIQEK